MTDRALELRYRVVRDSLVFETLRTVQERREFTVSDLQRWGFHLLRGVVDGTPGHFVTGSDEDRGPGTSYRSAGRHYEVLEKVEELRGDARLSGSIELVDGHARLAVHLNEGSLAPTTVLLAEPAGALLLGYLKASHLDSLIGGLQSVGRLCEIAHGNGQEGRAHPYEDLPPSLRGFLVEARKLDRAAGFGRISLAYFGEASDHRPRFRVVWLTSTLALFNATVAEKMDRILAEL